jgi:hypothetical protein
MDVNLMVFGFIGKGNLGFELAGRSLGCLGTAKIPRTDCKIRNNATNDFRKKKFGVVKRKKEVRILWFVRSFTIPSQDPCCLVCVSVIGA